MRILTAAAMAVFLCVIALPAVAQRVPCMPREVLVGSISGEQYAERQIGVGLTTASTLLEIHVGPSGSWTAFVSMPSGISCIVATGESWTVSAPPKARVPPDSAT